MITLHLGRKITGPNRASYRRITKEYNELQRDPPVGCSAGPIDEEDMYNWQGWIAGPEDTPYEGGVFFFDIEFPEDYPFKPPKFKFTTKIYHLNINTDGVINHPILRDEWSPGTIISAVLLYMQILLSNPFPENIGNLHALSLYEEDSEAYYATAIEWTYMYA